LSIGHTRREFLRAAGVGAVGALLLNTLGCRPADWIATIASWQSGSTQSFRSRPDIKPPAVGVNVPALNGVAPGYVFVAVKKGEGQDGPMILDNHGHLVWFPRDRYATDFKVQTYKGEPVLTWWQGGIVAGHGVGEYVIFDSSYREVRRVRPGNGYKGGDLHEFSITPQDTALLTIYNESRTDLSPIGGQKDGPVWDGIAQELDLETGEVLFEWHSLDHVGVGESYRGPETNPEEPVDYFHINSIEVEPDGNFLIDAKGTWAAYKVDRESGEILWCLGGKRSDFEMGFGTRFAYQHDARRQPDGTITIFDNGASPRVHDQSRGIVVDLDEEAMRATLVRQYTHPEKPLATSQGNMQVLPNGNVFLGWGTEPFTSEYSKEGKLLFDLQFPGEIQSYRAFRQVWSGRPAEDPAVAAERGKGDKVNVYASWNGSTETTTWRVLAGPDPGKLEPVGSVPWEGFETAMEIRTDEAYVAVRAEDGSGRVLRASKAIKPAN
jgi:hypothetical protein